MHSEKEGSLGIRDAPAKTELMRQKFIKWSIELGVHGYPNIFRVHSWLLKWMWIVSLLAAVGGCCYLIQLSVREYLEYNVNTRIRTFIEMPMALPGKESNQSFLRVLIYLFEKGIKICQNVILSQAGIDYALNYYRNKTGSTGLRNLAEAYRNYSMSFIELSTMFSKLSIDVPKESLGVELNKFMISCTLGTRNCTEYPYSYKFQDSTAGYCLTVNEGTRGANNKIVPESIYQANRAGSVDGLWAFFYLGSSRRMFLNTLSIANGVGLGVRVFNQSESPVTFSSDILASPGYCTLIRVTKTVKISMPEPYSRCRDLNSFSSDLFNKMKAKNITYKQSVCIEMCFHNVIMANCSCATEWLANIGTNLSLCRSSIQADCAYTTYRNNIDLLSSQCLDQCLYNF